MCGAGRMNCQIEFVSSDTDNGVPCGKPAVTNCADCGVAICSNCRLECCGDSFVKSATTTTSRTPACESQFRTSGIFRRSTHPNEARLHLHLAGTQTML